MQMEAKAPHRNNAKAKAKGKIAFQFIVTTSPSKPGPIDRRAIRSHVVRGKGRPKRATVLSKPCIGSWIRVDDEPQETSEDQRQITKRSLSCPPSPTTAEQSEGEDLTSVNVKVPAPSRGPFNMNFVGVSSTVAPAVFEKVLNCELQP